MSGVAQLGANSGDPRNRIDSNDQVIDNFSWKINKHDVKFGFDFYRTTVTQPDYDRNFRGKLEFSDTYDGEGNLIATGLQNFLAGDITGGYSYFGNADRHTFENSFGFYVQDSYRLTPHFTLNYGLRWDYIGVIGEKGNLLSNVTNFDLSGETFTLTPVGQPGLSSLYNPDKKDFAPRVSIAWDVTGKGKTVVRSGIGMFFDASSQDMVIGHFPYASPYAPGPAFNNVGPDPYRILSASLATNTMEYNTPLFAASAPTSCGECDTFSYDRNIKTPYMENYNLNIQQQLTSKTVIQVGYVGSEGHRLWRFFDLRQPSNAQVWAADCAGQPVNYPNPCPLGTINNGSVPRNYSSNPYGTVYLYQQNVNRKIQLQRVANQFSGQRLAWHYFGRELRLVALHG